MTVAYSQALLAVGGVGSYSWAITSGSLPGGLTLSPVGDLAGTPTAAGTFNFIARATDSVNTTATRAFFVCIHRFVRLLPGSLQSVGWDTDRVAERGLDPSRVKRPRQSFCQEVDAWAVAFDHQQGEFIASDPGHDVRTALDLRHHRGRTRKKLVTGEVPGRIIDQLEVVEVDDDDAS